MIFDSSYSEISDCATFDLMPFGIRALNLMSFGIIG